MIGYGLEKKGNVVCMQMYSIASGSSGNCIYVGTDETHLLVDAGISGKRIENGLKNLAVDPKELSGILVTHEHLDHIQGLGVMARRYKLPIYATAETIGEIISCANTGKIDEKLFREVRPEEGFCIRDMEIMPVHISHDAVNPVCYTFCHGSKKMGIATDLGTYDKYLVRHLKDCDVLLLESNHDKHMLETGGYPYQLKQRILGKKGHLSNDHAAALLSKLVGSKLKHVFLGHLSKENNMPDLAYMTVKYELDRLAKGVLLECEIEVADRQEPSCFVNV